MRQEKNIEDMTYEELREYYCAPENTDEAADIEFDEE